MHGTGWEGVRAIWLQYCGRLQYCGWIATSASRMTSTQAASMTSTNVIQALRESAVLFESDNDDVLRATGNDRVGFLHRITSGKVSGIEPGNGGRTLLLDVRGHVLVNMLAFVRPLSVRLVVPGGQGTDISGALGKFAIMDDFQIAPEGELTTLSVLGPEADQALARAGVPVPAGFLAAPLFAHQDLETSGFGPLWIVRSRRCGTDSICLFVHRDARHALFDALLASGVPRLSPEIAEPLRIAALEPAPGKEISPARFPVEIGLGLAIDHSKGCYVGQETIVRMRDRGTIRKRLALLRLTDAEIPSAGDAIATEAQASAGQVTSAARLPGESPVALAVLASAVPVGATVQVQHDSVSLAAEVAAETLPWG